ncbi:MAG TPA: carboxymuconolactone decarboxylase family protein [Streptosporangiaceae bacterium]
MRASQINGCAPCVDAGVESARKTGVPDQQLHTLVAWRETSGPNATRAPAAPPPYGLPRNRKATRPRRPPGLATSADGEEIEVRASRRA